MVCGLQLAGKPTANKLSGSKVSYVQSRLSLTPVCICKNKCVRMLPFACVIFTCECTHNTVDCSLLNAGQHVTLHMSLGFVSSQRQDWNLGWMPDIYNCPSGILSSLPEGHAQHIRRAVDKTKLPLQPRPQHQNLDSHSKCNGQ